MSGEEHRNAVRRAFSQQDGESLAHLLDYKHYRSREFILSLKRLQFGQKRKSTIDSIYSDWIECSYILVSSVSKAFPFHDTALKTLLSFLNNEGTGWILPVVYVMLKYERLIASKADKERRQNGIPEECDEIVTSQFRRAFNAVKSDRKDSSQVWKGKGLLRIVNESLKHFSQVNALSMWKSMVQIAFEQKPKMDDYELCDWVTFHFFAGRLEVYQGDFVKAVQYLDVAFLNCPSIFKKCRRVILQYLIPAKLVLGQIPRIEVLKEYEFSEYFDVVMSVRKGDPGMFQRAMDANEVVLMERGVYLLLENARMIVNRNFAKNVVRVVSDFGERNDRIDMNAFYYGFRLTGVEISYDEVESIIASLIFRGHMLGYIAHRSKLLVVPKDINPFPRLSNMRK